MDQISLFYYAAVCAILGYLAPSIGRWHIRLIVGALVGIAAAALLPTVRTLV